MTLPDYDQLKQKIVLLVGNSNSQSSLINILKQFYEQDIDSKRRYEQIDTLGKLMKVLEIRDVLSQDNVAPLKEICRRLDDNELVHLIWEYENSPKPRECINYYVLPIETQVQKVQPSEKCVKHLYENLSSTKIQLINDTFVKELGKNWLDLARNLNICDNEIEEIDRKCISLAEKAKELLVIYKSIWDPQRWFYELCDALEKSRRKDLCKSLQNIMAMDI